ncbi:glutaredoxin domain-containing cysteine-rich protein CG31559 [Cotesia typhae]|uniref:glutaredoxin domain-containing cysteine-rich protein CG31559 n=1 Tax=Cotesia typhae TaxID=2053667 RepID=UPI003D689C37
MGVVPKTRFACLKMRHILNTHMVQYEERDLYRSSGLQTELKDRLESDYVQVPQLFIDGQHIGDADAIEQLNESGDLRSMLKPYKFHGARKVCGVCGDDGFVPCISCHGSKKSWRWHGFLNEICALRCTNCDEMGLMPCPMCLR